MPFIRTIQAPLRIDVCGGFTDVPEIFAETGVTSICNVAIDLFRDWRRQEPVFVQGTQFYDSQIDQRPTELRLSAKLPPSTGLGSSAAYIATLMAAMSGQGPYDKRSLFRMAIAFERDVLRMCGGYQDFITALHGGFNHIQNENADPLQAVITSSNVPNRFLDYIDGFAVLVHFTSEKAVSSDQILRSILRSGRLKSFKALAAVNTEFARWFLSNGTHIADGLSLIREAWGRILTLTEEFNAANISMLERSVSQFLHCYHATGAGGRTYVLYPLESEVNNLIETLPVLSSLASDKVSIFYPKVNYQGLRCLVA